MIKKMLINATHTEENRVAIVEDGILTELDIEIAGREQTKGNIYKAEVVRVEPGLQAAFIDYGGERLGFLQMGELHPSFFQAVENAENRGRLRITDVLKRGQNLLVQVLKEERGTKGAALTTFLSLPGRYMVLMPESDTKGVSRKIEEESQRRKLKEAMASLNLPPNMGYIVRTAGIGQTPEELRLDFDYLLRVYQNIQSLAGRVKAPALVYKESNLVIRSIRDYFTADMDEVLVDDPRVFHEAKDFFNQVMPDYARLVKLHQERRPIFSRYQIEEQIETIYKNKVPLPSGGSIVIDVTEALVAIDVNSGKMAGEQGVEATAYKTNLEAAAEAGRQLRLRDLGGLIVLDFIDMRDRKHIREVEKRLKDALKYDKARVTVGRISQFGLLEMSRQRIKAALAEGAYLPCPHCGGSGRVKSPEAQTVAFLRKVHAGVAKGQIGRVEAEIPLEVATYLLNTKREEMVEMERQHNISIFVKGHPDFVAGQVELTFVKREKEEPAAETAETMPLRPVEREPGATAGPEAAQEAPTAEGAEEPSRKKRKRRRKKKPGEEPAPVPQAAETVSPAEAGITASAPSEGAAAAEETLPMETLSPEAAGTEPEESARKKRKRRRRKKPAEEHPAEGPGEAAEATAGPAEKAGGEVETGKGPEKAPEPVEAATAEAPATEAAPAVEAPAGAQEPSAEEAHRKKRRRHRRKKPLEATGAEAPAASGETQEPQPEPQPVAEKVAAPPAPAPEEEKTPRTRRRKKPAGPAASVEEQAAAPEAAVEKVPPHPSPGTPEKTAAVGQELPGVVKLVPEPEPVRPMQASASAPETRPPETGTEPLRESEPGAKTTAKGKPTPARKRRAAPKKAAVSVKGEEAELAPATAEAASASLKSVSVPTEAPSPAPETENTPATTEAPPKRRGRPRKKAVEEAEAAEKKAPARRKRAGTREKAAEKAEDEPEKKPAARRKAPTKKAEAEKENQN